MPLMSKKQWLQLECQKSEYQSPCAPGQKFECYHDETSNLQRIRKCNRLQKQGYKKGNKCVCSARRSLKHRSWDNDVVKRMHFDGHSLNFKHRRHRSKKFSPRAVRSRESRNEMSSGRRLQKRSDFEWTMFANDEAISSLGHDHNQLFDVAGVYELKKLIDLAQRPIERFNENVTNSQSDAFEEFPEKHSKFVNDDNDEPFSNITTDQLMTMLNNELISQLANFTHLNNQTFCSVSNLTTSCSNEVYANKSAWLEKKNVINTVIKQLQRKVFELKGIRRFINEKKPRVGDGHEKGEPCDCSNELGTDHDDHEQQISRRTLKRMYKQNKLIRKYERKVKRKEKFSNTSCEMAAGEQMNCFTHGNDHWKTAPLWNSNPNTHRPYRIN